MRRIISPRPDWLYEITWGLSDGHKIRILAETERYAIVQIPGGDFANGQVRQYGCTDYYKMDKQAPMRRGVGLLDAQELQSGGRAKLAKWKKEIGL